MTNIKKSLYFLYFSFYIKNNYIYVYAPVAQPVEHVLGKDEVTGSRPVGGFFTTRSYRGKPERIICENRSNFSAQNAFR